MKSCVTLSTGMFLRSQQIGYGIASGLASCELSVLTLCSRTGPVLCQKPTKLKTGQSSIPQTRVSAVQGLYSSATPTKRHKTSSTIQSEEPKSAQCTQASNPQGIRTQKRTTTRREPTTTKKKNPSSPSSINQSPDLSPQPRTPPHSKKSPPTSPRQNPPLPRPKPPIPHPNPHPNPQPSPPPSPPSSSTTKTPAP